MPSSGQYLEVGHATCGGAGASHIVALVIIGVYSANVTNITAHA